MLYTTYNSCTFNGEGARHCNSTMCSLELFGCDPHVLVHSRSNHTTVVTTVSRYTATLLADDIAQLRIRCAGKISQGVRPLGHQCCRESALDRWTEIFLREIITYLQYLRVRVLTCLCLNMSRIGIRGLCDSADLQACTIPAPASHSVSPIHREEHVLSQPARICALRGGSIVELNNNGTHRQLPYFTCEDSSF